jgi:hypothetical protein
MSPTILTDVSGIDEVHVQVLTAAFDAAVATLRSTASAAAPPRRLDGWTEDLVRRFDRDLAARGPKQRDIVRAIAAADGQIDRATLKSICGFAPARTLNGITKPAKGVLRVLARRGNLPAGCDEDTSDANPMRPWYADGPGQATDFFMEPSLAQLFVRALGLSTHPRPNAGPPESGTDSNGSSTDGGAEQVPGATH